MQHEPWHLRLPVTEHYQKFEILTELHELSKLWLQQVHTARPAHTLTRGLSGKIAEDFLMLDSLSSKKMEDFLDDTAPSDLLARMEHAVWAVQSWTLTYLHSHARNQEDSEALTAALEQGAWQAGKSFAEKKWKPSSAFPNYLDGQNEKVGRDRLSSPSDPGQRKRAQPDLPTTELTRTQNHAARTSQLDGGQMSEGKQTETESNSNGSHPSSVKPSLFQPLLNFTRNFGPKPLPQHTFSHSQTLLSDVLSALKDSPLFYSPEEKPFLIKRCVPHEIELELFRCPHHLPYHEVVAVKDQLCNLHWQYARGFVYALSSRILSECIHQSPRCIQRWRIV